jgi:hypothetical protein
VRRGGEVRGRMNRERMKMEGELGGRVWLERETDDTVGRRKGREEEEGERKRGETDTDRENDMNESILCKRESEGKRERGILE